MSLQRILTAIGDVAGIVNGPNNLTATTDPTVNNDGTQGYTIGSIWYNAVNQRIWECWGTATGAAVWSFDGAAYNNGGSNPASEVTAFGLGTGLMGEEGNVSRQISSTGVSPAATGGDYVLAVYALPANSFDIAGRGVNLVAMGSLANNSNNKRLKLIFNATTAVVGFAVSGGTTVCDTGTITVANAGWALEANVFKYGATGSNTQIGLHQSAQAGSNISALLSPSLITATESSPILIAVTGNATMTASDILFSFFEVNAMN